MRSCKKCGCIICICNCDYYGTVVQPELARLTTEQIVAELMARRDQWVENAIHDLKYVNDISLAIAMSHLKTAQTYQRLAEEIKVN